MKNNFLSKENKMNQIVKIWRSQTRQNLEQQRTRCEVYSRVVGYLRPVKQWNDGKQAEFHDRKEYNKVLEK